MEKRNRRTVDRARGIFIAVDGLDGIGKGEVERAIVEYEQKLGRAVLDTVAFSRAHRKGLPELKDFWNPPETYYDTLSTAEPTYAGIGRNIREEIVAKNERGYSSTDPIQAYGLDRLIQMKRVTLPALANGLNVVQARCCAATLCYQTLIAEDEGRNPERTRKYILRQEGNRLQLEYAPNLLIIPLIQDEEELIKRLMLRKDTKKDDNSIFDNAKFQGRANPLFRSDWLKALFESHGTRVEYLDASISEQETRRQALEIYLRFLKDKVTSI